MDDATGIAALAGLLHDIGKIAVRAGEPGTREWDIASDFIEASVPEAWRAAVKEAASSHHRASGRLEDAVALADRLSAGVRVPPEENARAAQPQQLLSIFTSLQSKDAGYHSDAYWPLAPLALSEKALFPGAAWATPDVARQYREMWEALKQGVMQLAAAQATDPDIATYLESLLLLLQRFTWSMPATYGQARPDVSRYDHARMTAALAAVLVGSGLSDAELAAPAKSPEADDTPLALLVGGDVSGIQDFIYTISSRGATSALRGRSFYLQLLVEGVVRYILRRLGLPITNVIYAGGGNFYLIARPTDADALRAIQAEISRILRRNHGGALFVAMEGLPLTGRGFYDGRISDAWRDLAERLQYAKQRRFTELGDALAGVFEPEGHGGNEEHQCQVCGNEHPGTRADKSDDDPEGVRKCPQCVAYEGLGDALRRADFLALDEITPAAAGAGAPGTWKQTLAELGMRADVSASPPGAPTPQVARRTVLALNDESLAQLKPGPRTAIGRRLLVNVTPILSGRDAEALPREEGGLSEPPPKAGDIKPFDMLERDSAGITRLGVLRMDVDDLGRLFAKGFPKGEGTLSRMAALSFAMSLFFEGWVAKAAEPYQRSGGAVTDHLYSIYSGGDDLFVVGSWDAVVEFAIRVRRDLGRFAAYHPAVHASAGIVLVGGKYPLSQAAEDAAREEGNAKGLHWRKNGNEMKKDAISFLGQAMAWEQFGLGDCAVESVADVHALAHRLHRMSQERAGEDHGTPAALLRQFIGLYEQYAVVQRKRREQGEELNRNRAEQALWGPWMWRAFYTLSRMAQREQNPALKEDIVRLRDQLQQDQFRSIERIGLAARWAELRLRQVSPNTEGVLTDDNPNN